MHRVDVMTLLGGALINISIFLYHVWPSNTYFIFFPHALLFIENIWISFAPFTYDQNIWLLWVIIEMTGLMWVVFEENFPKAFLYIHFTVYSDS